MNHPRAWRAFLNLAAMGFAALMLSCGGGGSTPPAPPPAPVATSLTTSNATPAFGGTFTLTPVYSAGTGTLNNGVTCPATGVATAPITANWTTGARIYTLTVTNSAGVTATKSVTVTPQTVAVGAISPAAVTRTVGTTTTFTTTVTGGALNTINWSSGGVGTWAGNVWTAPNTAGSVTITATSADDPTKTATTTVTVVAAPVATSLAASTQTPAFGATFTLTPTYSNGTGAINNGVVCPATGATVNVTANWSGARTFTLTVTNDAGLPATTSVVVTPQTVAVGAISPAAPSKTVNSTTTFVASVTGGALNTVSWSSGGAGTWAGNVWTAPNTAGSATITATSVDDPTKSATTTVTVVAAPTITSFAAAKSTITNGNGTTLSYVFSGGDGSIDQTIGAVATGGTTNVSPTADTTYTLTVTNTAGDFDTATATITVVPAATITAFTASATTVAPGSTVTLHAEYAGGVGTLNQGLGPISNGGDVITAALTATTTFTLTVTNGAEDPVSQSVTVYVVGGTFTSAGAMNSPRYAPTATLLVDNSVLIVGGSSGGSLATADVYSSGTYTATAVPMSIGRFSHAATRLGDGKVLITGGFDSVSGQVLNTAEIYNPAEGSFTATVGTMTTARMDHTATLLSNGLVLVAGGTDNIAIKGAELFNPADGTFTALTGPNAWPAPRTRATHTATLLVDGTVLLAGGYNGAVFGTADIYNPLLNTFTAVGDMGLIRWGHSATLLPDGKVLFTGGRNGLEATGAVLAAAELYDPVAKTFSAVVAPMISPREWHVASLLADGTVLIAGGDRDETAPGGPVVYLSSAEIYNPASGLFTTTASMASTRANATATLVPTGPGTGFVLIAGGGGTAATERFQ